MSPFTGFCLTFIMVANVAGQSFTQMSKPSSNLPVSNNTSVRFGLGWKLLGLYLAAAVATSKLSTTIATTTVQTLPTFPTVPTFPTAPTLPTFPTAPTLPTFPTVPTQPLFPTVATPFPSIDPRPAPSQPTRLPTFPTLPSGIPSFPNSSGLINSNLIVTGQGSSNSLTVIPATPSTSSLTAAASASGLLIQCACVPAGSCVIGTTSTGTIDIRIVTAPPVGVQCPAGQIYCCVQVPGTTAPPTGLATSCGRQLNIPVTGVTLQPGQAAFGKYPWSAIVFNTASVYVSGGTLISASYVLTVAHNVLTYSNGAGLKVRLGEWNAQTAIEPYPYIEINVAGMALHPSYDRTTLRHDAAILLLANQVPFGPSYPQIAPVCLPPANGIYTGQRCYVSGWGKDSFTGSLQATLKEVDLPVLGSIDCQTRLRTTRLGAAFVLDPSFVCAGGEYSKDACTGDGGSGLVCPSNTGYVLVGLTSWGIGCGSTGIPGVYTNIVNELSWIYSQIQPTSAPSIDPRVGNISNGK